MTLLLLFSLMLDPTSDIRELLTRQTEAWNRGDLKGFLDPYLHTDELTFFSGDTVTRGFAAIQARYERRYGTSPETMGRLRFEDLDVTLLGPDAVVARGRFRLQMKDGNPTGIFTLILRKSAGKWMIVHDHTSTATGN